MYTLYFGKPDAANEDLNRLYPELFKDILSKTKNESRPDGRYIISGIRGSGKTALRTILREKFKGQNRIALLIDKRYVIPSHSYRNSSALYFHLVANWILIQVHNELIKKTILHPHAGIDKSLRMIGDKIKKIFGGLLSASTLKAGIIEIDFDKLQRGIPAAVSKLGISDYLGAYGKILNSFPVYVFIDDVDTVFEGASTDDSILNGCLNAVGEINASFKDLISVIVFPNLILERKFASEGPEAQKYNHGIKEISWRPERLVRLISLRIAQIRGAPKDLSDEELWGLEFSRVTDSMKRLELMNISGPRDIIGLANMAKQEAGDAKISPSNIDDVLIGFAKRKYDDINRDHGPRYVDIGQILKKLFSEGLNCATRRTLTEGLGSFRIKLRASKTFEIPPHWKWFWDWTLDELIEVLYYTSAIGVRSGKRTTYFRHDPSRNLNDEQRFAPHPLFEFWAKNQRVSKSQRGYKR